MAMSHADASSSTLASATWLGKNLNSSFRDDTYTRLVSIHPFANGRTARVATSMILRRAGYPPPTWSAKDGMLLTVTKDFAAKFAANGGGDVQLTTLERYLNVLGLGLKLGMEKSPSGMA